MAQKNHSTEELVAKLREAAVLLARDQTGVDSRTYIYKLKPASKLGGCDSSSTLPLPAPTKQAHRA